MQGRIRKKKLVLKKWVRIFYIIILSLFACLSLFLIYNGLFPNKKVEPYYNYNIKRNIEYKVYLKPNDFFEEEYLGMNKQYTSQIIDYIDIDFSYLFNGSKLTDIKYDYDIDAQIIGEYENTSSGKSEIWNKKYTLLETQKNKKNSTTTFNVNKNLKIDYNKYNKVVNDFKSKFKLAIDANLVIKCNINYTGTINEVDKQIKGKDTLKITIPLSKSTININTDYKEDNNEVLDPKSNDLRNMNQVYIGVFVLIIIIIIFILSKNKLFINKKTYYSKTLQKILKDYSEIIVEISSSVNFENLEILEIKNFEDMIDIEEELKSPILLYEIHEGKECWFIVVNNNYAYRYILDSSNI